MKTLSSLGLGLVSLCTAICSQAETFQDFDRRLEEIGADAYYEASATIAHATASKILKVAILDSDFGGWEKELSHSLPQKTGYKSLSPKAPSSPKETPHGLAMAQILYGVLSHNGRTQPPVEFLLLEASEGYSVFNFAIQEAIQFKADIVLDTQVWTFGSNGDGKGFFNSLVNQALEKGILWVQAAGNYRNHIFASTITTGVDQWVELGGRNQSLEIRCLDSNSHSNCPIEITLNWNDFKDKKDIGTSKDLDVALTDDLLNIVESSSLRQVEKIPAEQSGAGLSLYPREIISTTVRPGVYFIRVKDHSQNFSSTDQLRIVVSGENIELSRSLPQESLLPPADNPGVLTVGACDDPDSSSSLNLSKPELVFRSELKPLNSANSYKGSSNAAALAAGSIGLLKMRQPDLKREEILRFFHTPWEHMYPQTKICRPFGLNSP